MSKMKYATDFWCSVTTEKKVDDIITLYSDGKFNHGLCAEAQSGAKLLKPVMQPLPDDVTFGVLEPAVEAILNTKYVKVIRVPYEFLDGEGYIQRKS